MSGLIAFLVGGGLGFAGGALFCAWWLLNRDENDVQHWNYSCTCGWQCVYLASVMVAPSFLRCEKCKGVAVRQREPLRVAA